MIMAEYCPDFIHKSDHALSVFVQVSVGMLPDRIGSHHACAKALKPDLIIQSDWPDGVLSFHYWIIIYFRNENHYGATICTPSNHKRAVQKKGKIHPASVWAMGNPTQMSASATGQTNKRPRHISWNDSQPNINRMKMERTKENGTAFRDIIIIIRKYTFIAILLTFYVIIIAVGWWGRKKKRSNPTRLIWSEFYFQKYSDVLRHKPSTWRGMATGMDMHGDCCHNPFAARAKSSGKPRMKCLNEVDMK